LYSQLKAKIKTKYRKKFASGAEKRSEESIIRTYNFLEDKLF